MKKLLLVLLVAALVALLFVGCLPVIPPAEGEEEGEGECEVTVEIDGAVVVDGKTYISAGNHDITVTFCAPVVGGAIAYITCCTGYYGKVSNTNASFVECGSEVVLFPNADRTVWTGSGYFGCDQRVPIPFEECVCCASYVEVYAGECEDEACIWFPVIVDSVIPDAVLEVSASVCECGGCQISFTSMVEISPCNPDEGLCWDDCSGIAGWYFAIYDQNPYDECCDMPCVEPLYTCTGVDPFCPIECVTSCLDECDDQGMMELYVVLTMWDMVGNENVEGNKIIVDCDSCEVVSTNPIDSECVDPLIE